MMHILIVTFQLKGLTPEQYHPQCEQMAPVFANVPGLLAKMWLADPRQNTYGGVYIWQDRQALEHYQASELYQGMLATPSFSGITVRDFGILDVPTQITRGWIEVAPTVG